MARVLGWPKADTGFVTTVPVTQVGRSTVCVFGIGTGRLDGNWVPAINTLLGCRTVDVCNAFGSLDAVSWQGGRLRVQGWASDPNRPGPVEIHVYDSGPGGTVGTPGSFTGVSRPDVPAVFPGTGPTSGFDVTVPTSGAGPHTVCAFAITTGGGTGNTLLGCRDLTVG